MRKHDYINIVSPYRHLLQGRVSYSSNAYMIPVRLSFRQYFNSLYNNEITTENDSFIIYIDVINLSVTSLCMAPCGICRQKTGKVKIVFDSCQVAMKQEEKGKQVGSHSEEILLSCCCFQHWRHSTLMTTWLQLDSDLHCSCFHVQVHLCAWEGSDRSQGRSQMHFMSSLTTKSRVSLSSFLFIDLCLALIAFLKHILIHIQSSHQLEILLPKWMLPCKPKHCRCF